MKKYVWIMNHYASTMFEDHGGRHYSFVKYLKQAGYEPVVFCANSKHNTMGVHFDNPSLWHEHIAEELGVPFVFVKARAYRGNGGQRIGNMADFYRNVKRAAKEYAAQHGKPDVIYASSVHPLTLIAGIQLAKKFGVKCICEARDLWPESIVALGIAGPHNPAVIALRWLEKWIYKKADAVVFTMEGAYDYIMERGWEKDVPRSKVHYINNGVDLEAFQYNQDHFQVEDPDLENSEIFKLVYTGSIRKANGLSQLLECAELLRDNNEIRFLVYGSGDDFEVLREICREKGLNNIRFKGQVEKKYIPYILSKSNVTLLNYAPESVNVYRFGNSQNKLFEYLASGKPVLTNVKISYNPADRRHCSFSATSTSTEDYAKAVLELYELSQEEYKAVCRRARETAEEYDFRQLTKKLVQVIEGYS